MAAALHDLSVIHHHDPIRSCQNRIVSFWQKMEHFFTMAHFQAFSNSPSVAFSFPYFRLSRTVPLNKAISCRRIAIFFRRLSLEIS